MDTDHINNTWKAYEELRKSSELIFSDHERCFYAARYSDVEFFLKSGDATVDFPFRASRQVFGKTILDSDDNKQILIKKNLTPFFSKKAVTHYHEMIIRPCIKSIIAECVGLETDTIDYNFRIAQRIPTQVIMQVFGIDLVHERYLYSNLEKLVLYIDHPSNSLEEASNAKDELLSFLRRCLAGEIPVAEHGILSSLDTRPYEDEDEVLRTCLMLLTAGMATTIAALNILLIRVYEYRSYLADNCDDTKKLRRFVEEVIRVEPPLHATIRFMVKDLAYNDTTLKKNDMLKILLASANKDERKYDLPEALNLGPEKDSSCTFGKGRHACIGADLAIAELIVFIQEFLPYADRYEVLTGSPTEFEGNVIKMFRKIKLKKLNK